MNKRILLYILSFPCMLNFINIYVMHNFQSTDQLHTSTDEQLNDNRLKEIVEEPFLLIYDTGDIEDEIDYHKNNNTPHPSAPPSSPFNKIVTQKIIRPKIEINNGKEKTDKEATNSNSLACQGSNKTKKENKFNTLAKIHLNKKIKKKQQEQKSQNFFIRCLAAFFSDDSD